MPLILGQNQCHRVMAVRNILLIKIIKLKIGQYRPIFICVLAVISILWTEQIGVYGTSILTPMVFAPPLYRSAPLYCTHLTAFIPSLSILGAVTLIFTSVTRLCICRHLSLYSCLQHSLCLCSSRHLWHLCSYAYGALTLTLTHLKQSLGQAVSVCQVWLLGPAIWLPISNIQTRRQT